MRHQILLAGLLALAACTHASDRDPFATSLVAGDSAIEITRGTRPPDADPTACYDRLVTPAVVETVARQVRQRPPRDARGPQPAVFVTETSQRIVEERRERWFRIPCEMVHADAEFIASLQRALAARGLYAGPITGEMNRRTERAIRDFQAPQGLDSAALALASAQQLGLALWNPDLATPGG